MNVHLKLFIILLITLILKSGYGSTSKSVSVPNKPDLTSNETREQDRTCGTYCYKVVKPLLDYAASVRAKEEQFEELQNKIHDQDATITKLQQQYASKDEELTKLESKFSELQSCCISSNCLGKSTGVYKLNLPNIGTFDAPCDSRLAGSGWTVVQRRIDGSVDFNRNWEEYKAGFGDLRGEFFLGLEKLHLLTQFEPHELYIHLEDFDDETRYAKYSHLLIGNETESYELKKIGDYSGTAGDSLKFHINMKFSTKDRDNDKADFSCADYYESGWWFLDCSYCNLNGQHSKLLGLNAKRISWNSWHHNPIKFVQIMIRPILR